MNQEKNNRHFQLSAGGRTAENRKCLENIWSTWEFPPMIMVSFRMSFNLGTKFFCFVKKKKK